MAEPQTWWKWRPTAYPQLLLTAALLFTGGLAVVYVLSRDWGTSFSYAAGFTVVSTLADAWRVRKQRRGRL